MKQAEIRGIKCDSNHYWLFRTIVPDNTANQIPFSGENNKKISLSDKSINMSVYTVFFDPMGRPYTSYTDADNNIPVSSASPLSITVNSIPASTALNFSVTPETGFIQ